MVRRRFDRETDTSLTLGVTGYKIYWDPVDFGRVVRNYIKKDIQRFSTFHDL